MAMQYPCSIVTLDDLERLACVLSALLRPADTVFLHGPLGVGKSSLVRFLLRKIGHNGVVPSPTYGLVHSYAHVSPPLHHFDLYRLHDLDELAAIGAQDFFSSDAVCVVEWPDLLLEWGINPSWIVHLSFDKNNTSRYCVVESSSSAIKLLEQLMVEYEKT